MKKKQKEIEGEIISAIASEVTSATTESGNLVQEQRNNATRAYNGQFTEDTVPTSKMSSVIYNVTRPSVDALSTYMTKIFCSKKKTVEFTPTNNQLLPAAKQAEDMVNTVIMKHNGGHKLFSRMFKDAAINKVSVAKVYWEETPVAFEEIYENTTPEAIAMKVMEKEAAGYEATIVEEKAKATTVSVQQIDPLTGQPIEVEQTQEELTVVLRCEHTKEQIKIDLLAPEDFIINEDTPDLSSHLTRFVGHRKQVYRTDLQDMFPDADIDEISKGMEHEEAEFAKLVRSEGTSDYWDVDQGSNQEALQVYELIESYIRYDADGDNYAEWIHCFSVGNTLLHWEEHHGLLPFVAFSYFPIPHAFYGLSIWDKVRQYEKLGTAIMRAEVDVRIRQLSPQMIVGRGLGIDQNIASGRPGIFTANKGFDAKDIYQVPSPMAPGNSQHLLQLIREHIIAEIGVDHIKGQISADVEKSGNDATKTAMALDSASARIESYAREFIESCQKELVWLVFQMLVEKASSNYVKKLAQTVSGQPIFVLGQEGLEEAIDKSDLTATVGLGHLSGMQKAAAIQSLMGIAQQLSADPASPLPIPPMSKLNMAYEAAEALGFSNPETMFGSQQEVQQLVQQAQAEKQQAMQAQQAQMQAQQQQMQMQAQQMQFTQQLQQQNQQFQQQLAQEQHTADVKEKTVGAEKTLAQVDQIEAQTAKLQEETPLVQAKFQQDVYQADREYELERTQERGVTLNG